MLEAGQRCDGGIVDDVLEGEQEVTHGRSVVSHAASVAGAPLRAEAICPEPQPRLRMLPLLLWMSVNSPVGSDYGQSQGWRPQVRQVDGQEPPLAETQG